MNSRLIVSVLTTCLVFACGSPSTTNQNPDPDLDASLGEDASHSNWWHGKLPSILGTDPGDNARDATVSDANDAAVSTNQDAEAGDSGVADSSSDSGDDRSDASDDVVNDGGSDTDTGADDSGLNDGSVNDGAVERDCSPPPPPPVCTHPRHH